MGKNGIKTVKYHNEEKNITAKHSNIDDIALKRIRKYCGKKTKDITKEEKEKYKAFFERKECVWKTFWKTYTWYNWML